MLRWIDAADVRAEDSHSFATGAAQLSGLVVDAPGQPADYRKPSSSKLLGEYPGLPLSSGEGRLVPTTPMQCFRGVPHNVEHRGGTARERSSWGSFDPLWSQSYCLAFLPIPLLLPGPPSPAG